MSLLPKKFGKEALLGYLLVLIVPLAVGYLRSRGLFTAAEALEAAARDGGLNWSEIIVVMSTILGAGALHNADNGK